MTTREIVKETINHYLDIMQAGDLHNRINLENKIDLIAKAIDDKLNERNSVDEGEKSFVCCDKCHRVFGCEAMGKCFDKY